MSVCNIGHHSNGQQLVSLNQSIIHAMKINMGSTDRIIRMLAAVIIVILYLTDVISGVGGIVLLALAAILAITSLVRFCPLYLPFGFNTNRENSCHEPEMFRL